MSHKHTQIHDTDLHTIHPSGNQENTTNLSRLDSYLTVLEDNRKAAEFIPDDANLALDMAQFICDQLQGRKAKPLIPMMRQSLAILPTAQTGS